MQRKCRKCGYLNNDATGSDEEACPSCSAIYSRVEAVLAAKDAAQQANTVRPARQAWSRMLHGRRDFLQSLRAQSNYPTFRGVVQLATVIGYIITGAAAAGTAAQLLSPHDSLSMIVYVFGLCFTAFLFILTRLFKEISLMIADGCDALVHMAEQQDARR